MFNKHNGRELAGFAVDFGKWCLMRACLDGNHKQSYEPFAEIM